MGSRQTKNWAVRGALDVGKMPTLLEEGAGDLVKRAMELAEVRGDEIDAVGLVD